MGSGRARCAEWARYGGWARYAAFALVVGLTACGRPGAQSGAQPGAQPASVVPIVPSGMSVPEGWRLETYRGVAFAVPPAWRDATAGTCLTWTEPAKDLPAPYVGRPGPIAAIGCPQPPPGAVDPRTKADLAGRFVWLDTGSGGADSLVGDRATLTVNGVVLQVQAPAALREQIVATITAIPSGANGCPVRHDATAAMATAAMSTTAMSAAAATELWRPPGGTPVASLREVTAVSACRYSTQPAGLFSSLRLTGQPAAAAVAGLATAPVGGGPNTPGDCARETRYGDEVIVLRIESAAGLSEVVVRYAGCEGHGIDDGSAVRTLTRDALRPWLAGPNAPTTAQAGVGELFLDLPPAGPRPKDSATPAPNLGG